MPDKPPAARIDFEAAATVFADRRRLTLPDVAPHMVTLGEDALGRLLVVRYTEREGRMRISGAREATDEESSRYREVLREEYDFSRADRDVPSPPSEPPPRELVSVWFDVEVLRWFRREATRRGCDYRVLINEALRRSLDEV